MQEKKNLTQRTQSDTAFAETTRPASSAEKIFGEDIALHTPLQAGGETLALA